MARPARFHGFLNLDKPSGMTSTDVVRQVRRLAGQSQVGHGGTLDPLATGVLPVALGSATRLLEYLLQEETKRYTATVRLGATTTTDDAEGELLEQHPVPPLSRAQLEQALAPLRGTITQVPPIYAAIRVNGRRLYEYARAGETVEIPSREITLHHLELLDHTPDTLILDALCSKGTYIRALARDLGAALGCGAHLTALRRTRTGSFDLAAAVTLEQLAAPAGLVSALLPPQAALRDWPQLLLEEAEITRLRHGLRIPRTLDAPRAAALDAAGQLVAVLEAADDGWQPVKVFPPSTTP